jgi:hypothetical protein
VAVLVLDKEGWELLTLPKGPQAAWDHGTWGPALSQFNGQDIVPGQPFIPTYLAQLFERLSSVNLCPCRSLEEQNWGMDGMLDNMQKYVTKNLAYFKQHAEIGSLADKWQQRGQPASLLLHQSEASKWLYWCTNSESMGVQPATTELQKRYVQASGKAACNSQLRLRLLVGLLVSLILLGGVASAVLAVSASRQYREAASERNVANTQKRAVSISAVTGQITESKHTRWWSSSEP